ncbi:MAG TPA: HAMP domain-containing sensor histidine kinase [Pseudacidobacterium sp.]|jgi:signal transduction histidine kinase|nr:HAMP domain-containing sensor histidine kinase [Pseudacidobacterium sp.]
MQILKLSQSHSSEHGKRDAERTDANRLTPELYQVSSDLSSVAELLRQNQKLTSIGRLTASIVHEINNPLEAVANLLYLMEQEPELSSQMRSFLKMAQQELGRVIQISKQTLNFSRETSKPIPVLIEDLMEEVMVLFSRRLQEKEIHLFRKYDSVEPINVYPGEIRQVLSNLIVNAIEACPVGGSLWLRLKPASPIARKNQKGVRIIVADNGSGIDPALYKKLGMPFVTSKGQQGTGLGLWVTMSILARYGTRLQIRSASGRQKHGTVISIFMPAEINSTEASGIPDPPAALWRAAG